MKLQAKAVLLSLWEESYIGRKIQEIRDKRKKKQIQEFVAYIQSLGLSIVKLKTLAGVQYIEALDGSWRKVGGKTEDPDISLVL